MSERMNLSQHFLTSLLCQNIQAVITPVSKSPETQAVRLLSNNLLIHYLEAPDVEKSDFLKMYLAEIQKTMGLVQSAYDAFQAELNTLQPPLQNS